MSKIGFNCFTTPEQPVVLTMRQKVVALTLEQRGAILKEFIKRKHPHHASIELGIEDELVHYMYSKFDEIQDRCRLYMRGEVIITPAVTHMDTNTLTLVVDTPAVFNVQPSTATILRTTIASEFIDDFPGVTINNVVNEMIAWSKFDGTGTFAFYKSQIIL